MPRAKPKRSRPRRKLTSADVPALAEKLPAGLNPRQYEACLHYLANGHNMTAAYRAAHPGVTERTARELGSRMLANVNVRAWLLSQLGERWKALHMSADEAIARVAFDARADVRLLFNADGFMLPPQHWPDEVANSIHSVEPGKDGGWKVRLNSSLAARRLILELTGKLSGPGDGLRDLAEILAEKWKESE